MIILKLCEKCGAQQSDSRNFCIDCGELLANKLENNESKIMNNKIDPLYVSIFDKIVGYISILSFILCSSYALIPKFLWELKKDGLSFTINGAEDAEPSHYYLIMRRFSTYALFTIAIIALIFN